MTYCIKISNSSKAVLEKWKRNNKGSFSKACLILEELMNHPRTGIGHPEPLKGGHNITWSRRVTAKDRIIYDIYDDTVEVHITTVGGHYNDK